MKESKATHYLLVDKCNEKIRCMFKGITAIPFVRGKFCCDFDFVENELPTDLVNALRAQLISKQPNGDAHMPMGINKDCLPLGSKLVTKARYEKILKV